MGLLELRHVSRTFRRGGTEIRALQDVSLSIERRDIFGIIGFSGAGKSTLLRCMNLLETPDPGSQVIFDGCELTALGSRQLRRTRASMGMIFQHFNLMPSRTALENVLFPLAWRGLTRRTRLQRAEELLELVGLGGHHDRYPAQLSGGQQQRVAIARPWPAARRSCCATRPPRPSIRRAPMRSCSCCASLMTACS